MAVRNYDFCGWVTKFDTLCSDGRVIRKDAFKDDNGLVVPLVWNHDHKDPQNVLGNVVLEHRDQGMYGYGSFNDTEKAQDAKILVEHGDIGSMSIYANKLKQSKNKEVLHGKIREVSLVLAGANPGATIEFPIMMHGEDVSMIEDEAIIEPHIEELVIEHGEIPEYLFESKVDSKIEEPKVSEVVEHSEEEKAEETEETVEHSEENSDDKEKENMADNKGSDEKTLGDVLDTLNEEQRTAVEALVGMALEEGKNGNTNNEEDDDVKHNVFDAEEYEEDDVLTHAEIEQIFNEAKRNGSLKDTVLAHSIDTEGMVIPTGHSTYGFNDPDMLFPDYKNLNNPPEWIKRDMDWIAKVNSGVHKTPFSRIRSTFANITEDEARAKGYIKGNQKKTEVFSVLKRTTDPTTVYKLQKFDRDDMIDITDFNSVSWIRTEMDMMLEEEKARAILIGDGRLPDAEDKIAEDKIRPIVKDVPLFNVKVNVSVPAGATGAEKADAIIESVLRSRKEYKGSGNPTFFTTEDWLTEMLLLKDGIGHYIYKTEAELATRLRVKDIVTVEVMENYEVDNKPLVGVIVNLSDYNVGADKGGEKTLFDDFDIDFNKYTYLIETRMSGALIKPYSAMTVLIDEAVTSQANG
jgi:HK97 family phage prohead protease